MIRPTGPCPAKIMVVGEAPGEQEIARGEPFVGYTGAELGKMMSDAGIYRNQCFMTNVIRVRPPGNNPEVFFAEKKKDITLQHVYFQGKYCLPVVMDGVEMLKREIEQCQPNVIIAVGKWALWALTGESAITSWRGSTIPCTLQLASTHSPKVIPILSPAMVMKQWSWRQLVVADLKRAKKESESSGINSLDYAFVVSPEYSQACAILDQLYAYVDQTDKPVLLSCDIETRSRHIACIAIAWSEREAICIPLMSALNQEGYWSAEEEANLVWRIMRLLCHKNAKIVGQNFIYDTQYIYRSWKDVPNLTFDTMIGQHSMFPSMEKSLGFLSSLYCQHHKYWKDDGKTWDEKTGERQLWTYNCEDAARTYEIALREMENITKMRVEAVNEFQQALFYPVLETMMRGIRVDTRLRSQYALMLMEEISKRDAWFEQVLGHSLNPRSSPQMKKLFYEDFAQKQIINRKTGAVSCDDEALRKLAEREPLLRPLVNKISEHRSLCVFFSTFVQAPLDSDGRMRCSFNIAGTETYRFSSSTNAFGSGLNLQNIPKGGEAGDGLELPNIRELFIPDPGYTFFDIDLSSADLRIVVWESDEGEMKDMLRQGLDPYTEIAKEFYKDAGISKKDPRRQTFKSFAHGTHYLGTAKGLAERLGLSVHDSEKTQKWYFQRFPRIKKWQDQLKSTLERHRFVENIFGYKCYFLDRIEGTVYNQAAAWIPQSTVGCLINRGYMNIYRNLPDVQVLLQVHDSLAGQFPSHLTEQRTKDIVNACSVELPYADPLIIPVGIKTSTKSWGGCE